MSNGLKSINVDIGATDRSFDELVNLRLDAASLAEFGLVADVGAQHDHGLAQAREDQPEHALGLVALLAQAAAGADARLALGVPARQLNVGLEFGGRGPARRPLARLEPRRDSLVVFLAWLGSSKIENGFYLARFDSDVDCLVPYR